MKDKPYSPLYWVDIKDWGKQCPHGVYWHACDDPRCTWQGDVMMNPEYRVAEDELKYIKENKSS